MRNANTENGIKQISNQIVINYPDSYLKLNERSEFNGACQILMVYREKIRVPFTERDLVLDFVTGQYLNTFNSPAYGS